MEELDSIWNFGLYRYLCVIYNSSNTIQVIIHVGSYLNFGLLIEIERNRYRYIGSYFIVNNTTSIYVYLSITLWRRPTYFAFALAIVFLLIPFCICLYLSWSRMISKEEKANYIYIYIPQFYSILLYSSIVILPCKAINWVAILSSLVVRAILLLLHFNLLLE